MTNKELLNIIEEELQGFLDERCQKGYKTHPTTKTKKDVRQDIQKLCKS